MKTFLLCQPQKIKKNLLANNNRTPLPFQYCRLEEKEHPYPVSIFVHLNSNLCQILPRRIY